MNKELVASLALFKTLYKSKKGNVLSIIALYIVSILRKHKEKDTFMDSDIKNYLKGAYNIDIPAAVIQKTCIENQVIFRMSKKGCSLQRNFQDAEVDMFESDIEASSQKCDNLISAFYSFVATERKCTVQELEDKIQLKRAFLNYVKDQDNYDIESPTCKLISQYVIENDDEETTNLLDDIREGLIIYDGMRYADPSNERTWKCETTFVLDVQYLFSSFGLNSSYHKECFEDFYNLVKFINDGVPYKAGRNQRITLCYFPETTLLVNKFFKAAERIKLGEERLDPGNEAMTKIVGQCSDEYSVKLLKHKFIEHLKLMGINECNTPDLIDGKQFLFETGDLNKLVDKEFEEDERDQARDLFKFADYINIWRRGKTSNKWEDCGYVFLSDSSLTNKVSKFLKRNDNQAITPVFQRMEWFTQKLWFASRRPLIGDKSIASFSVINRAKNIVSSLCKESVTKAYKEYKSCNASNIVLEEFYNEIRSEDYSFENVNKSNVRGKISISQQDALLVFLDAKKRREENDRLQREKIAALEAEISKMKQEREVEARFNSRYGWWFNNITILSIIVGVIMFMASGLFIIVDLYSIAVLLNAFACLLVCSNWLPIVKSFKNKKKEMLLDKIRKESEID